MSSQALRGCARQLRIASRSRPRGAAAGVRRWWVVTDMQAAGTPQDAAGRPAPGRWRGGSRIAARVRAAALGAALATSAAGLAGCAEPANAGPSIQLNTAYVAQSAGSGPTAAYVVIQNNGPADRLIAARTSAGGAVALRGPSGHGAAAMQTVRSIRIPARSVLRLNPISFHLLITGARPMRSGTDITLTLVFARAGAISVSAAVTNAATGGSSYLLN